MDPRLQALISGQQGLVTRQQALAAGLSAKAVRWRVESGRWVRLHPGVYLTTPGRNDWHTIAAALLLHLGVPSALSSRSAAYLWGLVPSPGPLLHCVVPTSRRPDPVEGVVITRARHALERTHETAWPHRITVEHTVFDLAVGHPVDTAVGLIALACQKRLSTPRNLRVALDSRPTQPSRRVLYEVIGDVAGGVESSAERRYVRDVEQAHGLPAGRRQEPGPRETRRDNAYDEVKVVVEIDGRAGHAGWRAQQRDGHRDRRSAAESWLTVRGYWSDVHDTPCSFARELEAIFRSRGWRGRGRRCRRPGCDVGGTGVEG
ncbi:type IV toxin-antitoxin system AbiEi family antitoxin domain-containing protein [Intrasporangium oryzae]|uniref:type IV toxin-antitoxin system AbiEi family antitoxin domain-containing protein n=1 Tax=Intrasporangium oryzae TaxID=412687 RepID=UPI000557DF35|nr:type IV toxin-antitoxin system AbiEi family antitoxin domain-containing protein [Intrasporangium oryzae]